MTKNYETKGQLMKLPPEKEYEKQTLKNDFIFGKVMQDRELCLEMLELLTGNVIDGNVTINEQKPIRITSDSKGVRYDVYVEEDGVNVYDAEMQNDNKKENLPKRSRYYQGMIDLNLLESGGLYEDLINSYVIFICTFDPFEKGLCCYRFENSCDENDNFKLDDGRTILFFNTKGKVKNISKEVEAFLEFIENTIVTSEYTNRLSNAVEKVRQNKEWRVEYMKTWLHDMDVRNEGREEGREEGIRIFVESLKELQVDDKIIRMKLIEKYGLKEDELVEYMNV